MPRLIYSAWTLALVLAGGFASFRPNNEADIYFHLDLGRAVLRHGARVVPEPTAFAGFDPTCVVPVWLWDVWMYATYQLGGFEALGLVTVLSACASVLALCGLCARALAADDFPAFAMLSSALVTCVLPRYQVRPQTFAAFVLPLFLWLVLGYLRSSDGRRVRLGIAIGLVSLLWAQVHNSFVLAPALFFVFVAPSTLHAARAQRRVDGLVFVACLGSLLSSAHGLDIVHYTLAHGGGDAVRHIREMGQPTLADVIDLSSAEGRAFLVLCVFCTAGIVRGGALCYSELLAAALGFFLFSRAYRFSLEAAILIVPLAAHGVQNLLEALRRLPGSRTAALCTSLALALLGLQLATRASAGAGPGARPLRLGVDDDAMPKLASAYLKRLPEGSNVLTAHSAGSYIGFYADGRIRTYVDGRTPMYFSDADFAVAREAINEPTALELVWRRWNIRAMVIERDHPGCDAAAKRWLPVVIEGRYTTFVPPGVDTPLLGVDPCGPSPLRRESCASGKAVLDASIARLEKLGQAPIISFLRAGREITCGGSSAVALRELEKAAPMTFASPHTRLLLRALLREKRLDEANALLHDSLERGDLGVLNVLGTPEASVLSNEQLLSALKLAALKLDDATTPEHNAQIAFLCMQRGDIECVTFHALRAAARGELRVLTPLAYLARSHPSERVRADAKAWAELLSARARESQALGVPAP